MRHHILRNLVLCVVVLFTSTVQVYGETMKSPVGDVNGDGAVTVADVMLIVNFVMGNDMTNLPFSFVAANINKDDAVTVTDAMIVVSIIMGAHWDDPDNPTLIIDDGEGDDPGGGL